MKAFVTVLFVVAPALAHADAKLDKSATWDCKKDPVVSIGGGEYTFKGPCTTINLGAGKNTLDIESVDTLNINAGSCTITAANVDTVNLTDVAGQGRRGAGTWLRPAPAKRGMR